MRKLAFVLSEGGARGALQVGALQALLEAGYRPDMLVGTSIGAANAAHLALHGVNLAGIQALRAAWRDASLTDLLPANYLWLTVRSLFRSNERGGSSVREFCTAHGIGPDLRFADISGVQLLLVAADLHNASTVLYGTLPEQSVLAAILASTALPPWLRPLEGNGQLLMDGGVVSSLPIEPALQIGATEIVALDLADRAAWGMEARGVGPFLSGLLTTTQHRETEMELALAAARGVPVLRIALRPEITTALWDFTRSDELIDIGYEITRAALEQHEQVSERKRGGWQRWLESSVSRWQARSAGQVAPLAGSVSPSDSAH